MQRRSTSGGRGLPARIAALAGLLAVLSVGCGQVGNVHRTAVAVAPVSFQGQSVGTGTGVTVPASTGPTGDIPETSGPTISGNNGTLKKGAVTKTVTVTQILPQAPQFQLPVSLNMSAQGPFRACPVQAAFSVSDGFGAPRYAGGYHPHAGNDILAPQYSPIVAPFDGTAEADPNTLGGNAVIVKGKDGYVYNAHLVSYGKLGTVQTGDVIGYVGNTGDAAGGPTHDHFEWHPYAGPFRDANGNPWVSPYGYSVIGDGTPPAVDPFPFLEKACPHN